MFAVGSRISISKLGDHQVRAYHENEKQMMLKTLDKYISTCARAGVLSLTLLPKDIFHRFIANQSLKLETIWDHIFCL